jgi:hypothetical protein
MAEPFSHNIGLLTQAEQNKLSKAKVAIPGMGGCPVDGLCYQRRSKEHSFFKK